jgi:predicted lipoprotein with Yx(FWY)xxD motif
VVVLVAARFRRAGKGLRIKGVFQVNDPVTRGSHMTFRLIPQRKRARLQRRSARLTATLAAGAAGLSLAGLVGMASAQSPATVATATNATLGETIAVDSHGRTVYELSGETAHHLLCMQGNGCFHIWKPVTVASAKTKLRAAHGTSAKVGLLHRNGIFQVTLGGRPLYRFVGDGSTPGAASGQGIQSFGGTWHVVVTAAGTGPTTPTTPTVPTTPTMPTTPTTPTTPYYPPIWGL